MVRWMIPLVVGLLLTVGRANALDAGPSVTIVLDAEEFSLTAPMQVASDANALGGKYIIVPKGAGNNGSGSTSVQFPVAGDYYLWGRVKAPSGAGHSFYIEIGGKRYAWLIAAPTDWHWERVSNTNRAGAATAVVVSVTAPGAHTLKVLQGEEDVSLDQLVVTNNAYFVPTDHRHR